MGMYWSLEECGWVECPPVVVEIPEQREDAEEQEPALT